MEQNRLQAVLFGHAIGDALGVPVEFRPRTELCRNPVTGFRGYGSHHVPAGCWSDDTSMALAAMDSLTRGIDFRDQMDRFCRWRYEGAYTATGTVFDFGIATDRALRRYKIGSDPLHCGGTGEASNGNGSLMRIYPAALYAGYRMADQPLEDRLELIHQTSALTHAHPISQLGCGIYTFLLWALLDCPAKEAADIGLRNACTYYAALPGFRQALHCYSRLFDGSLPQACTAEIQSSGYVADTLEAALWCLLTTDSFSECVLKAVNLGDDTDTVGAIAGSLAGALYGAVPEDWKNSLLGAAYLLTIAEPFLNSLTK